MQNRIYRLLTWIVLLLGLAGSVAASYWVKFDIDTRAYQQFVSYCEEIQLKIVARLEAHEQILLGGAAMFDASKIVERQEWRAYVDRLRLDKHFDGIQGLGFALWIPADQLPAHQARIRAEGFPDYNIHPEGKRDAYSSIIFLEPFTERNLRAFGYDMYSEPVRGAAMARSRDENHVTLSGRVTLVQETNKNIQAGSLMYAPVYKKGQPIDTVEQRRAALFGWVYSPFRMTDLLNNIVLSSEKTNVPHVHLHVYDGNTTQEEHLLYDNDPNYTSTPYQHRLSVELTNNFNGTIWTLQFEQIIGANDLDYRSVWITLSTGVLISLLLFLLLTSSLNTRANAVKIANKLTKELQESESRFRILADNAPVLIWIIEPDKLCSHVNKVWLNFTGRTLEQELGNGWAEGVHADDLQRCMAVFISSFDAHLPFTTEYRLRRYDGEYRWLLDNGVPRFADDGSFLGYIGSCIDITDNKEAQIIIEKTSSLLQATLESSNEAILVVDFNNTWVLHNQNLVELWHIPNEIIISNDDNASLSFIVKQVEDAEGFLNKVFDLYNSPEACSFDIINLKNGKIIERYSIPQRINGKVVGRVWRFRDITARKTAEIAIAETHTLLRTIIDTAPMRVFWKDSNLRYLGCNLAFAKDAGMNSPNDVIGKDDYQMGWADQAELYRADDRAVLESGIAKISYDELQSTPNGKTIWLRTSKVLLKNYKEETIGLLGIYEDITDYKRVEIELVNSQQQLQNIITGTHAGTWEWNIQTGEVVFNERWANIIGYELAELQPISVQTRLDLCHPDDLKHSEELLNKHFTGELDYYQCECRMKHKQGHWVWVIDRGRLVSSTKEGKPLLMAGTHIDISESKKVEAELRIAATVFESQEGMMITDANEIIINVNKAFTQITGYDADEVVGQTPRLLHSGRQDKEFYTAMWQRIDDTGEWHGELWNQRKNGDIYPEQLTITAVTDNNNTVINYVATFTDITERKAIEDYIHRLAFYDALTQLPNRRLLQERIKHGIELNHRTGNQMAVLMMDLDKFKAVNDTLGHAAGDELLQQVAERVKASLREVDMVARLGGDEFVILLENVTHYEDVAHVAQSIIDTLSQPFTLNQDHEASIGASIGIGVCPQHGNTIETLMDNADAALYHAKDSGRGCFAYFSEALTKKAQERLALESRLRGAIEQQELSIYFQPQIEINSGRLVGAETLVYWNDSDKGERVILKDFITLAEETGVAVAIGEWALRETCKLGRQWLDEGLPMVTLAVNISAYQFRCGDIKNLVAQILDETGLPADYLGLEITETGLMINQQHALSILNSLNTRSIQLAIDDFGTGYSSLARLKSFPIDILKIDKTFIKNIPFSQDDMMITTTIIDMAHHLDFKVLAEGVETSKQLTFLRQQGCDYYQGDLYSKALSAHDFALLLKKS